MIFYARKTISGLHVLKFRVKRSMIKKMIMRASEKTVERAMGTRTAIEAIMVMRKRNFCLYSVWTNLHSARCESCIADGTFTGAKQCLPVSTALYGLTRGSRKKLNNSACLQDEDEKNKDPQQTFKAWESCNSCPKLLSHNEWIAREIINISTGTINKSIIKIP